MKLELKDAKGLIGTIDLPVEELRTALGLGSALGDARLAEDVAKLAESEGRAAKAEALAAQLQEEVAHRFTPEDVNARIADMTRDEWLEIGGTLGYLEEATLDEAALGEPEKPEPKTLADVIAALPTRAELHQTEVKRIAAAIASLPHRSE